MNAPCADIATILQAAGCGTIGATTGWAISKSREPAAPDACITVYDYGGLPPDPKWLFDQPRVQVRVRGNPDGYEAAYAKARACLDALLGYPRTTIGGTVYVGIRALDDVSLLEYDASRRPVLTVNLEVAREPASGTYRT
jgi:hypothetical protein